MPQESFNIIMECSKVWITLIILNYWLEEQFYLKKTSHKVVYYGTLKETLISIFKQECEVLCSYCMQNMNIKLKVY